MRKSTNSKNGQVNAARDNFYQKAYKQFLPCSLKWNISQRQTKQNVSLKNIADFALSWLFKCQNVVQIKTTITK